VALIVLQAVVTLEEELDLARLEIGVLDGMALDLMDEEELDLMDEEELDLIGELDTVIELALDLLEELSVTVLTAALDAGLDETPVPLVGIEHSLVALAGLGSTPKVAVAHTKVPLSTL
jgi:hypothetical protein